MATIFAFNMRVDVAVRLGSERAKLKCPEAHNMLLSSDVVRYFLRFEPSTDASISGDPKRP